VRLGSVQLEADTASAATFTRVSVRAGATGDLQGITDMLQYLETVPELIAVREITLTQPDAGGLGPGPESLEMEITVQGLALVRAPSPGAAPEGDGNRQGDGDAGAAAIPGPASPSPASPSPPSSPSLAGPGGEP
jgi:hypothetical protein